MYALIDGHNFYVSCERLFRPALAGVPVVVLSHNDGCAIARSEHYVEWPIGVDSIPQGLTAALEKLPQFAPDEQDQASDSLPSLDCIQAYDCCAAGAVFRPRSTNSRNRPKADSASVRFQGLSMRRADAVKAYLMAAGIDGARISAPGKNESSPMTKPGDCRGTAATAKLLACLQPDRRVEVEVVGTR